jgi:AbiV family abortive infection protein
MSSATSDVLQPLLVARAAIQNAADLLEDADSLSRRARWGTAYALAALAFEEIGKSMLYLLPLVNPTITQAELDQDLRHHPTKLMGAISLLHVISVGQREPVAAAIGRAIKLAPEIHRVKMRGFYVDVAPNGTVKTPADVTEDQAVTFIHDLGLVVDVLRPWLTDEALQKMTELAGTLGDEFRELAALGGQLAAVNPEQAAEYARKMLQGWVPEDDGEAM